MLLVAFFAFRPQPVSAQFFVNSYTWGSLPDEIKNAKDGFWEAVLKSAKFTFANSLRTLVNQFAYDTATYIGSGGKGQTPVYFTDEIGPWLEKQGRNAGGQFIENFAQTKENGEFINKYGICAPDLTVQMKISLGLIDHSSESKGLTESRCNLQQIWNTGRSSWEQYTKDPYFWDNLSAFTFDPSMNQIGSTLKIFAIQDQDRDITIAKEKAKREEGDGWLNIESLVSGKIISPPGENKRRIDSAGRILEGNYWARTGDIFVDAANIFLNQLAISGFNKIIGSLNKDTGSDSGSSTTNYYDQGSSGGVTQVARRNSTILQAKFTERADYDVLSQLTTCSDEEAPGPTNCVINQDFALAISQQLTVAQAVEQGLLKGGARVGYMANGDEMSFKDGYPYRSLIILRKYRILPVGWEIAAQYMKNHPEETKQITLNDLIACYSNTDKTYPGESAEWCRGLIDPYWVLKLPKMFCGMEGYGSQILKANAYKDVSGVNTVVNLIRNDSYCADEQSCIKEAPNGTCRQYGYCTEEKRQWVFGTDNNNTCEPRNNTCQIFKNENGQAFSYLENTLNYADCDANQVGCKRYASNASAVYNAADKKINLTWDAASGQRYFNKNIAQCEASGEGCKEFIRIGDDLSTNLIGDGGFEYSTCITDGSGSSEVGDSSGAGSSEGATTDSGPGGTGACQLATLTGSGNLPAPNSRWYIRTNGSVKAGIVNTQASEGTQSLYIEGNGGLYSKDNGAPSILPSGFALETNTYYTLSASIYVASGKVKIGFGGENGFSREVTALNTWVIEPVLFYNSEAINAHDFYIEGADAGTRFYVDAIQLTKGPAQAAYSQYGMSNVIYQKLMPSYLEALCYIGGRTPSGEGDFRIKDNAPAECYKFARKCSAGEVGCQSYESLTTGISVTGKVKTKDACPESCVGYDTFVQQANNFYPKQAAYFIPDTATTCGARAVGCTAFTNLDTLQAGGEAIEYYTEMRQCLKPDAAQCGQFYTWEGSDESGYQIRVYSLNKVLNGGAEEPKSTMRAADEALVCNADVFKKLPTEAGYNYDCREFYAQDGSVSYHLFAKTISCSEDCHPYRREVGSKNECEAAGGFWDTQSRCIYNAIPGEGTTCAAPEVGCQEYTGNVANNTETVLYDTFENSNAPTGNWLGGTSSSTSLNVGGRSLSGSLFTNVVGSLVKRNVSYNVTFLARATAGNTTITALNLANKDGAKADFATGSQVIKTDWQLYSFNLESLDHDVTATSETNPRIGEKLQLSFSGEVYLDNIKLTAIPNRYYLIKDSWETPEECDQDFAGNPAAGYMLGCSLYRKTATSDVVALHSFSQLCDDSAAGCEAMIDTKNSSGSAGFAKKLINDTNGNGTCEPAEKECIETPADTVINVVYDKAKLCGADKKGCQRLGLVSTYDNQAPTFSDVYLKNDPDQYDRAACKAAGVGCSQWTVTPENGTVFFKDPGKEVCEWRLQKGTTNTYKWFKKGLAEDVACAVAVDKTIGVGGKGNKVEQPSQWAGECEAAQAGCTEYIDPLSKFNDNLILNPSYRQMQGAQPKADNWTRIGQTDEATQTVFLNPQTMYTLKGSVTEDDGIQGDNPSRAKVKITCAPRTLKVLDGNNNFQDKQVIDYAGDAASSAQFYIPMSGNSYSAVQCTVTRTNLNFGAETVYLRPLVASYQLSQNVKKTSRDNLVNFNKGAVLFNERSYSGGGRAKLTFNADATYEDNLDGDAPSVVGNHNANVLLEVQPDRTCSKWLDCLTYIPDPSNPNKKICLDIGECESFAPDGSCAARVTSARKNQNLANSPIGNLSGYSKVGYGQGESLMDYYRLSAMTQVGGSVPLNEGVNSGEGFENATSGTFTGGTSGIISEVAALSDLNLNPLYKISQKGNTGFLAPEGTKIAKIAASPACTPPAPCSYNSFKTKNLNFQNGQRYVLSYYSYGRGGELKVKLVGATGEGETTIQTIRADDQANQWVRRSVGFKATAPVHAIIFENGTQDTFIDDIHIDISLNVRCSDPSANPNDCVAPSNPATDPSQPQYIGPSCRLYPSEGSLSCSYKDSNNITSQGIKGYCLEADPRNPSVCLLWYPVDRISGDAAEEGAAVKFDNPVYYCIDAKDECVAGDPQNPSVLDKPQVYCSKFVEVDTSKYWAGRLNSSSTLTLPWAGTPIPFFKTPPFKIDLGGRLPDRPSLSFSSFALNIKDYFFGALYKPDTDLDNSQKQVVTAQSTGVTSFLPYYGSITQKKCIDDRKYYFAGPGQGQYYMPSELGNKFYGVRFENGSWGPKSLGEWDQCVVSSAIQAELEDRACTDNGSCNFNLISDIVANRQCPDGSTTCQAWLHNSSGNGVETTCKVDKTGNSWQGTTTDEDNTTVDDTEALCVFYCYNRVKEVSVTEKFSNEDPSRNALNVVRRLFPQTEAWKIYTLNSAGTGYTSSMPPAPTPLLTEMPKCPVSGRPAVNDGHSDYCYISPILSNFLINGKSAPQTPRIFINQRDYATFSYHTKTDAEQLPIRKIKIDFGYKIDADTRAEYTFADANFADINPRYYSKLYEYSEVASSYNSNYQNNDPALCAGGDTCYELTPVITITDNWGKCACINHDNTPCYDGEPGESQQCVNISAQNNLPLTKVFVRP